MKYHCVLVFFLVPFRPILAACGSSKTSSSSKPGQTTPPVSQTVQVTLSDTGVDSSLTTFTAGMPYHFVVTNTGQVSHQFLMIPMGMGMEHISADEMRHAALYIYDSVARDETRAFDNTIAKPYAGQSLAIVCGTQGHYAAGMQLPFMVNLHQ